MHRQLGGFAAHGCPALWASTRSKRDSHAPRAHTLLDPTDDPGEVLQPATRGSRRNRAPPRPPSWGGEACLSHVDRIQQPVAKCQRAARANGSGDCGGRRTPLSAGLLARVPLTWIGPIWTHLNRPAGADWPQQNRQADRPVKPRFHQAQSASRRRKASGLRVRQRKRPYPLSPSSERAPPRTSSVPTSGRSECPR